MVEHFELIVFGLLVSVAGLVLLSYTLNVPYPIFLVLGGLALGFVPGIPKLELEPELVLLIFLPPLLYSAAFFSSLRELQANLRPIGLLSIGLVVLTMVVVAGVAHWAVGLSWPVAFVLGAIISPTDPVAATATAERLGVPRRIVTVLEGESLINDGTGLVLYRTALGVAMGEAFSFLDVGVRFVGNVVGGIAIGLAVGVLIAALRRRIKEPLVEITITLFTPYAAYLPAEELGASGVLAAVTAGIYLGWHAPRLTSPSTRLQSFSVWNVLTFLLNSILFILMGLQLPAILEEPPGGPVTTLALDAVLVCLAAIVIRFAWVFPVTYIPRKFSRRLRQQDPSPPWQNVTVIAYAGMRGAVSLAAALALPFALPDRDLVIFLTFSVIFVTLVVQGLTLPPLIRWLDLQDDSAPEEEETIARLQAAEAALERIEELEDEEWVYEDTAQRMRDLYDYRRRRFTARQSGDDGAVGDVDGSGEEDYEARSEAFKRFRRELIEAERETLLRLRSEGKIGDEVMRQIERDLDLEESRLEV